MAQPIYFLPDIGKAQLFPHQKPARSILAARGLGDVFADVPDGDFTQCDLAGRGPGDMSGIVIGYKSPATDIPKRIGYYPAEQTWTPIGDGTGAWIGLDTASPPTPDDLRRREFHVGYSLELGDGNEWMIPVIRRPDGTTSLPCDMVWDAAGEVQQPIKRSYERFWNDSAIIAEWAFDLDSGEKKDLPIGRMLSLAVQALSINYRFGPNEQNLLRVVDSTNFATLLMLTVDYPRFVSLLGQKKTESTTVNTSPGVEVDSPTIDPAEPICA